MIKPVIVRDLFYEGCYYAFIPADGIGRYWWRQHFRWVGYSGYKTSVYPIDQAFFGIVRPGKVQNRSRAYAQASISDSTEKGWHKHYTTVTDGYIEWRIPEGHNRIHAICHVSSASNFGVWNVTLSTTSGGSDLNDELDITQIDLSNHSVSGTKEFVVAIAANSSGEKYLRFTADCTNGYAYISGVHSFDDDGVASPADTLVADGLGLGNDFVDEVNAQTYSRLPTYSVIAGTEVFSILKSNSCELTIRWRESGEAVSKWTSYGPAHFGSGMADFILTTKATLYVGGVNQGTMDDMANIALGELHEDECIYMYAKGFGDYDEDGEATPGALDIMEAEIGISVSANGIGLNVHIGWTADALVTSLYVPSIPFVDGSSGQAAFPPDRTRIAYAGNGVMDYDIVGATVCESYPDNGPCVVVAKSDGPNARIFEQGEGTICKQYHKLQLSVLPGGSAPASGTHWALGGHISIWRKIYEGARSSVINPGRLRVFR